MNVPKALAEAAARLASEINADAILALTETGENCGPLIEKKLASGLGKGIKVIIATSNPETYEKFSKRKDVKSIKLAARPVGRASQAHRAMACGLRDGTLCPGERLVCLAGDGFADITDSILVFDVTGDELAIEVLESDPILAATVELALELGRGGPGGKPVGTAFVVGKSEAVLRLSKQLMINPFQNYTANITNRNHWDLLKKYAAYDGAFVVDERGVIVEAHRYLTANARVEIPKGLGTRHVAVAAMTAETSAKGVTVSGEDGTVRIFERGRLVAKIDPNSRIIECLREAS